MRVLVVEDDRALGLFLQKGLAFEGHEVEWVADGESAVTRARTWTPDLVLLDLGLPQRDGREVLAVLSDECSHSSVLVLTGRGEVDERVRCLNLGADDFLAKPFSFQELTARCRALLRRRERYTDPVLRWADIELDRLRRTVERSGAHIELTGKEFALLESLMLRRGQTCTRAELLEQVWQMTPDTATNVLDVYVNYLRRKLGAATEANPGAAIIETVRGTGYRMAAQPARVPLADSAAYPQLIAAVQA
ncbi:MAG TPA: response regulator transcription factor [Acidobacteriaceae bacterium]